METGGGLGVHLNIIRMRSPSPVATRLSECFKEESTQVQVLSEFHSSQCPSLELEIRSESDHISI